MGMLRCAPRKRLVEMKETEGRSQKYGRFWTEETKGRREVQTFK